MQKLLTMMLTLIGIFVYPLVHADSLRTHSHTHTHAHGVAKLNVAVDGGTLTLALESPLDSLLGFEHMPRNDKERASVRTMENRLQKAAQLFVTPVAAQCQIESVKLDSVVLNANSGESINGHADLDGEFIFNCKQPQYLRKMTVQLFEAFPHLHQVDVQIVTTRGQSAAKLTAKHKQLKW